MAGCFDDRRATARCLICATDGSIEVFGEGVVEGAIAPSPRGDGGFGWDSAFVPPDGGGRSYGEMDEEEKNLVSHRHKAFIALRNALEIP
jgi:XTP/dITP diphosphohydrolase